MNGVVDCAKLVPLIEQWRAQGNSLATLSQADQRFCRLVLAGEQKTTSVDKADRLLVVAMLYPPTVLNDVAPLERKPGGWTRPDMTARSKISDAQARAANLLHIDGGLSIETLSRQLYERFGYANPASCATGLRLAFRRLGLPRRDQREATRAAHTTHGHATKENWAGYKRWHRATFGPWPSDLKRNRRRAA